MKTKDKKVKEFDTVKTFREVKEIISKDIQVMAKKLPPYVNPTGVIQDLFRKIQEPAMFKNYFKTATRNLSKNTFFTTQSIAVCVCFFCSVYQHRTPAVRIRTLQEKICSQPIENKRIVFWPNPCFVLS